jgi:ATP-binding cassette, subfamily G (WHITE), member 2
MSYVICMCVQGIQNRFGMLFFMMLFLSLMSLSSLPIWAEDMLLFYRERDSGAYSTSPYFLARVLFDVLPLRAVPPLLFTLITYPAAGLHSNSASCIAWFTITLVAGNTAAALLCMCLGALLPSLTLANMVRSTIYYGQRVLSFTSVHFRSLD